jgi:gluconokinase
VGGDPPVRVIVVMGVAGCGKTTVGRLLASRLGVDYAEGDDFHSPANVRKMADGTPLTDADRRPWLAAIESWITGRLESGRPAVVACSALKRSYRERLGLDRPGIALVYLNADRATLETRLHHRPGHFFRANMLAGQFADLEPPARNEALWVDAERPLPEIVTEITEGLARRYPPAG